MVFSHQSKTTTRQRQDKCWTCAFLWSLSHQVRQTWCERHHRNAQVQHLSCCLVVVLLWCENTISLYGASKAWHTCLYDLNTVHMATHLHTIHVGFNFTVILNNYSCQSGITPRQLSMVEQFVHPEWVRARNQWEIGGFWKFLWTCLFEDPESPSRIPGSTPGNEFC